MSTQVEIERLKDLTKLLKLLPIPVAVVENQKDEGMDLVQPELIIETKTVKLIFYHVKKILRHSKRFWRDSI